MHSIQEANGNYQTYHSKLQFSLGRIPALGHRQFMVVHQHLGGVWVQYALWLLLPSLWLWWQKIVTTSAVGGRRLFLVMDDGERFRVLLLCFFFTEGKVMDKLQSCNEEV
mmetsp:Transcript_2200/g.5870  ORF Transcript_2200/g.5870 Transcript_2200/m.5870 type:complete len:110 (-) Transcript_2200:45-374(-)